MKNGKLRKIQIVLVAILYALACIAGYHCNQARREPITRKAVALFDGLLMLGALIAAFYIIRRIAVLVRGWERSGMIVGTRAGVRADGKSRAKSGGKSGKTATDAGGKSGKAVSDAGGKSGMAVSDAGGKAGKRQSKPGAKAGATAAGKSRGFKPGSLYMLFEKHGKLKLFLVMFAIGMVFTCAKYPGIESGGIKYAYQQAMGMDSLVRDLAPVKYPGSYITGHHPVVMTVLFGLFLKAGKAAGHINWGSFALSIAICAFNSWGLSWVLHYFRRILRPLFWDLVFLFMCLNPMFASFNTYIILDGLFATALAVFCCLVHRVYNDPENPSGYRWLTLCAVAIPFIKNQGIYIVLFTLLVLMLLRKRYWKKILICLAMPILVFNILFEGVVMPTCRIAPGGKQEMYSILCQTVANAIVSHPDILQSEEYEAVHKVFPIEDWSIYDRELSDPIKFCYNPQTTSADFGEFLKAWFKIGLKYPGSYSDAVIWQTYGYYSTDVATTGWCWEGTEIVVSNEGDTISGARLRLNHYLVDFFVVVTHNFKQKWLFNIPFSMWMSLCCIVLYRRKQTELIWYLPVALQWMICLLSPVNGCGRYAFIVYLMTPFIMAVCLSTATDEVEEGEAEAAGA